MRQLEQLLPAVGINLPSGSKLKGGTLTANLVITGSADIIHKGNAAANTVTFSTASEKIGSHVLVECIYTADATLKWLVSNLGGTTATVA